MVWGLGFGFRVLASKGPPVGCSCQGIEWVLKRHIGLLRYIPAEPPVGSICQQEYYQATLSEFVAAC